MSSNVIFLDFCITVRTTCTRARFNFFFFLFIFCLNGNEMISIAINGVCNELMNRKNIRFRARFPEFFFILDTEMDRQIDG